MEQNGQNYRNLATTPFVQPDNPHMLLEEFSLPPTVVQSTIRRPPIQANNFELKGVTLQMLNNIQFHGLPTENPNAHLTSFIEVCDTVKYNGVTEEDLRLRLFPLSLSDQAKHWLTSQPPHSITELCRSARVQMLDSEEQVQQRLPIPLPRVRFGSPKDYDDETDHDVPAATPSLSDPVDSDPEVPSSSTQSLADQVHALTTHIDTYWDES